MRKIKKQNIFSYYYVGDVLAKMNAHHNDYAMNMHHSHHKKHGHDGGHSHASNSDAGSHGDNDSVNSSAKDSLADSRTQATEESSHHSNGGDSDDSDDDSHSAAAGKEGGEESEEMLPEEIRLLGKRRHGVLKQRTDDEPLTRSEEEFFDVLRMRTTELSDAVEKVVEFARRLWTSKEIRNNPQLNKLINIRVISHLSQWYFNTLSKRLIKISHTEKQALQLQKTARQYQFQAVKLSRRADSTAVLAKQLERTKQPWSGKSMLGPVERAAKKEHQAKVLEMKELSRRYENEAFEMRQKVVEYEKEAYALLPRIPLSSYVFNNYKVKIQAARHKASLLERMTLDDIKSGLFGTDSKDNLLNKEQMNAIHASLMNQKIILKDHTSLSQLIDNVLEEEGALLDQERAEARKRWLNSGTNKGRGTVGRRASLNSASLSLSLGSAGVNGGPSMTDIVGGGDGVVSGIALEGSPKHSAHHHKHAAHHLHRTHHHGKHQHHHAAAGHVHHKLKHHAHHTHKTGSHHMEDTVAEAGVALLTNGEDSMGNNRERSLTLNSVGTEEPEGSTLPPRGLKAAAAVTAVTASSSKHHKASASSSAKKIVSSSSVAQLSKSANISGS